MLKNIDPVLSPDLLQVLRAMGHGDDICLVDANFPAESVAGLHPLIRLDGVSMNQVANAVFSVLPLDSFVDQPMVRMEMVGQPQQLPEVQVEVLALARLHYEAGLTMGSLERFAFYEAARQAFVIVATGERRPYGCFLIKKGVLFG
ncbi:MAG: RbsD/FucU domain-containing protein [Rhodoferax sp.]